MHSERIAGRCERRPSATSTAIGNAGRDADSVDSSIVSGTPPQRAVSTGVRPATPPRISTKKTASTATHATISHRLHSTRVQLATSMATISSVATSGRHCSSNG